MALRWGYGVDLPRDRRGARRRRQPGTNPLGRLLAVHAARPPRAHLLRRLPLALADRPVGHPAVDRSERPSAFPGPSAPTLGRVRRQLRVRRAADPPRAICRGCHGWTRQSGDRPAALMTVVALFCSCRARLHGLQRGVGVDGDRWGRDRRGPICRRGPLQRPLVGGRRPSRPATRPSRLIGNSVAQEVAPCLTSILAPAAFRKLSDPGCRLTLRLPPSPASGSRPTTRTARVSSSAYRSRSRRAARRHPGSPRSNVRGRLEARRRARATRPGTRGGWLDHGANPTVAAVRAPGAGRPWIGERPRRQRLCPRCQQPLRVASALPRRPRPAARTTLWPSV